MLSSYLADVWYDNPAYSLSASPVYSIGLLFPQKPVVNIVAFVSQEEMSSTLQEPVLTERLIVTLQFTLKM